MSEPTVHSAMERIQLLERQMREICERVRQLENQVKNIEDYESGPLQKRTI